MSLGKNCRLGRIVTWDELSLYDFAQRLVALKSHLRPLLDGRASDLVLGNESLIGRLTPRYLAFPLHMELHAELDILEPLGHLVVDILGDLYQIWEEEWEGMERNVIIVTEFQTKSFYPFSRKLSTEKNAKSRQNWSFSAARVTL